MRIDSINKINQVYNANSSVRGAAASAAKEKDAVVISQAGRHFQVAKQAVSQAADVRPELVERIKAGLNAGTYAVTPEQFANKVVERIFETTI